MTCYFKFTIWPLIMLKPTGLDILSRTSHTYSSSPGYHLLFGCHVSLSSSCCASFSYFLCFKWPRLLGEVWVFYRMSFNCSMSDVSSWLDDGFWEGRPQSLCVFSFGHLMRRADSLEKTLMLGKIEGKGEGGNRGWDGEKAPLTHWTWIWVDSKSQ